ncbi:TPA: macro domain-containing protein [Citrobacter youngae]|nr:macro domain-containing protein [Citrobacter youngae]HEF0074279.1 macro domain-containing protein [Citrobacter youngae]
MSLIHLVPGDISSFSGDAIVNATNRHLRRGGGVCGTLHRAAGDTLKYACSSYIKQHSKLNDGDAILTLAGTGLCACSQTLARHIQEETA